MEGVRGWVLTVGTCGLLTGCGLHGVNSAATAARVAPRPTATPTASAAPMALSPGATKPMHEHRDMSRPLNSSMECDYASATPSLASEAKVAHGAVIARVLAIGAPVWNTPDGRRPTQAQADAILDPPGLAVFTPFRLQVIRVLSTAPVVGLTAGMTVTGYVRGGTTPFGDRFSGCFPVPSVPIGSTAVVFLGTEIDTGTVATAGMYRPEVWEFDPISGHSARTRTGVQAVP